MLDVVLRIFGEGKRSEWQHATVPLRDLAQSKIGLNLKLSPLCRASDWQPCADHVDV